MLERTGRRPGDFRAEFGIQRSGGEVDQWRGDLPLERSGLARVPCKLTGRTIWCSMFPEYWFARTLGVMTDLSRSFCPVASKEKGKLKVRAKTKVEAEAGSFLDGLVGWMRGDDDRFSSHFSLTD